ncbi:kinesin-like protein KIF28P [Osmerus eperlanus]|uniref:kinesin-like protein KIF28P n=1 Tax=Osmerus eperlanus TaxID=29151 RepID=UPI002E0E6879
MKASLAEMAGKDCVKVAVRVRPFNKRERDAGSVCVVSMASSSVTLQDPRGGPSRCFSFDHVYWSHSGFSREGGRYLAQEPGGRYADQACVFQDLGEGVLQSALQGYNATLLAYGQTGSGKSSTMLGHGPNPGLVPTLCHRLFHSLTQHQDSMQSQVFFSMLEIYNEQVVDLLCRGARAPGGLRVREEQHRGFYVEGLRRVPCDSAVQVEQLMEQGTRARTTATTHTNANSSRSHMLITLQLKQIFSRESITKQSFISLVDLAGSERQRGSGSEADRLKEGTAINLSLTTLGNVISALADVALGRRGVHVPYRDSVLTKLLQAALGGNSRTFMIATLSPADICYEESLSTLRYADRWAGTRPSGEPSGVSGQTDPSLLAVFYDYIKLMPMVAEANQMSQELHKEVEFKLEIKNLALSDARGHDLEKDIAVRVTSLKNRQVWLWSKSKFVNRKYLMEELYQQHQAEGGGAVGPVPRERDPFWDPVEPLLLGKAHLWLQSLAFRIALDEQLEVLGSEGTEEAIVQAQLIPCSPTGLSLSEEDILIDPSELLGRRLDFQLVLDQCCGLRWLRQARDRGVQIGFQMFDCVQLFTPAVWHNVNPLLDQRIHFTSLQTSPALLEHLQTSALVLELWGLQEGCVELAWCLEGVGTTPEGSFIIDQASDTPAVCTVDSLQRDLEALRKDNSSLRDQLSMAKHGCECVRGQAERSQAERSQAERSQAERSQAERSQAERSQAERSQAERSQAERSSQRSSCEVELGRSLKVFYHSMTSVRALLQGLRRHRPSEDAGLQALRLYVCEQAAQLKVFSEELEQSVAALKQDVAAIVRRKRERSGTWS